MGFIQPNLPVVDMSEWSTRSRAERIVPMARHIAEHGFGTPLVMHVMYGVKIALYILGGWLFAWSTRGIDGFTHVSAWWPEPIVFQKAVLYTMLFEVIGLGCCFGPLAGRYFPPMGSILYWLRPGTIRLPPWPTRVPLTNGNNRTPFDALLYGILLVLLVSALLSDGSGPIPALDTMIGVLPWWRTVAILAVLAVLGLRDKVIFLAARGEVYAPLALTFLFAGADIIVGAKIVFMVIWLARRPPSSTSTSRSSSPPCWRTIPFIPSGPLKRSMFKHHPDDLRPSALAGFIAHFSTAVEGLVPLRAPLLTRRLADGHRGLRDDRVPPQHPAGLPHGRAAGVERVHDLRGAVAVRRARAPGPVGYHPPAADRHPVRGHRRHRRTRESLPAQGFLPARHALLRRQLGHHPVVRAAFSRREVPRRLPRARPHAPPQLERLYGSKEETLVPLHLALAFRGMNTHGRALLTLAHRAMAGYDEDDYNLCEGEICAQWFSAGTSATGTCTTNA